jgi:hypothetical protein
MCLALAMPASIRVESPWRMDQLQPRAASLPAFQKKMSRTGPLKIDTGSQFICLACGPKKQRILFLY